MIAIAAALVALVIVLIWGGMYAFDNYIREDANSLIDESIAFMNETAEFARGVTMANASEHVDESKQRSEEGKDLARRIQRFQHGERSREWYEAVAKRRPEINEAMARLLDAWNDLDRMGNPGIEPGGDRVFWPWSVNWTNPSAAIGAEYHGFDQ